MNGADTRFGWIAGLTMALALAGCGSSTSGSPDGGSDGGSDGHASHHEGGVDATLDATGEAASEGGDASSPPEAGLDGGTPDAPEGCHCDGSTCISFFCGAPPCSSPPPVCRSDLCDGGGVACACEAGVCTGYAFCNVDNEAGTVSCGNGG